MFSKADIQDIYPLSPMQEGMFFHWLYDPEALSYFEQTAYRFSGSLDPRGAEISFNNVVARHDALRTIFNSKAGERCLQIVLKKRPVDFDYQDISNVADQSAYIKRYLANDRNRKFDLTRDVLFRVALLKTSSSEFVLIWSHHHIIMDGWCKNVLIDEFVAFYRCYLQGRNASPAPATQFGKYIEWLGGLERDASKVFWNRFLADFTKPSIIAPVLYATGNNESQYANGKVELTIETSLAERIQSLAARLGVTANSIIQAAWGFLLSRINRCEDVVFGLTMSGRPHQVRGVETIVGLFINTIPFRVRSNDVFCFSDLVRNVQKDMIALGEHQYSSLSDVLSGTELKRKLFDHLLVFEDFSEFSAGAAKKICFDDANTIELLDSEVFEQSNYDFIVNVDKGRSWQIRFEFNGNCHKKWYVRRLARRFLQLLESSVSDPVGDMKQLSSLSALELKMLDLWKESLDIRSCSEVEGNPTFFELGGNSDRCLQFCKLVKEQFNVRLSEGEVEVSGGFFDLCEYVEQLKNPVKVGLNGRMLKRERRLSYEK